MYNAHRAMGPGPGPQQPVDRLNELLQQVRAEFEQQAGRSTEHEHQCKSNQTCDAEKGCDGSKNEILRKAQSWALLSTA